MTTSSREAALFDPRWISMMEQLPSHITSDGHDNEAAQSFAAFAALWNEARTARSTAQQELAALIENIDPEENAEADIWLNDLGPETNLSAQEFIHLSLKGGYGKRAPLEKDSMPILDRIFETHYTNGNGFVSSGDPVMLRDKNNGKYWASWGWMQAVNHLKQETQLSSLDAYQKHAESGWQITCRGEDYADMSEEWLAETKWSMSRTKAPFAIEGMRQWCAPTFNGLSSIIKGMESKIEQQSQI